MPHTSTPENNTSFAVLYGSIVTLCTDAIKKDRDVGITTVVNCKVPFDVMLTVHGLLENKLDSLPADEKNAMWEYAYKLFPTKTKDERWNICKVIHTANEFLKLEQP